MSDTITTLTQRTAVLKKTCKSRNSALIVLLSILLFIARIAVSVLIGFLAAIVAFYIYKLGVFCMGFFVGLVSSSYLPVMVRDFHFVGLVNIN